MQDYQKYDWKIELWLFIQKNDHSVLTKIIALVSSKTTERITP